MRQYRIGIIDGTWAVRLLLALGVVVRIVVWLQNRSLFLDEANLARNFCERGFWDFFQPLDHEQYAPPLFCFFQKCSVALLGQHEYALRLFPLLCGIASVFLFHDIARRLIAGKWVAALVLWIFCFSDIFLRYATEGKQYGCDLAVALGLVALAIRFAERPFRPVWAAAIGAVALWLSMPAVFVLFGAGWFFLKKNYTAGGVRAALPVLLAGLFWLLNFALYYALLLHPTLETAPLVQYHTQWFFPLFPQNSADWGRAADLLATFPYYTAGYTVLANLAGSAGILTGLVLLFRRRTGVALLLVLPVLACLIASGFGQYSLLPRMLVWAFPLVLLVQGVGWQVWWAGGHRYLRVLWLVLWIATAGLQKGVQYLVRPFILEEIRPVLDAVARDFQPDDVLYVHHEAWPAVTYYRDCHTRRERYFLENDVVHGNWDQKPDVETISAAGKKPRRVWLVFSHVVSDVTRASVQADLEVARGYARQVKSVEQVGACGYLFMLPE
ncbi:MAG: glycosyltransferase family 39 protein [Lewinellaceae bacterium]|nr:glycosyltransferase family 39 protein [Lewinellaceae bacterium]